MRFIKPDGNVIWLHSACSPVNENGTEYVGILTDITQTKNLERQLSEKEEQLNAIMDNPLVGIMVADETAKVIEVNHVFEQFVGKKRHQLINTYIWDLMGEMNQSGFRSDTYISIYKQKILDSLEKGYIQFSPMEVITIEKPSGERLVLHQNVFIFKTHKGIRIGALMIDLTELEAERKAKQDSETAYRALFEQGPFEISVSRLSGEITDVNDQFCANMGRPRWEILGKSSIELGRFTEEQVRQLREYSSKHSGIIDQYEMTQKVNNQERTVLLSSRVITQQNQPVAITIVLDISERKAAEQKIIHQLEELNGLRNIDTSILMGSDLTGTLTTVLQQAVTSLQIQTTQMLLYGNLNEQLIKVAESGNLLPIEPRFEDTEYPAWKVIREGRTVFIREDGIVSLPEHLQEILKINNIKMYCATPIIVNNRIQGVLEGFVDRDLTPIDPEWINYFETLAGQAAIAISNSELIKSLQKKNEELLEAYESTIVGWANALEIRDEETFGHSERVLALSIKVAHELKMDEKSIPDFRRGVLLHDIGKIGIPDSILMKPGSLDESEWIIMRQHPVFAYQLLKGVSFLKHALDVPYCHHERWNGTGYPRGLKGEDIPLPARIFSVVDVWDALTNDRPYRKAWSKEKTLDYLKENAGTQFDPHVVDLFIDLITKGSTNPE